jgi:hypothetical protein
LSKPPVPGLAFVAQLMADPARATMLSIGIHCAQLRGTRRAFASVCLDWSERRAHIAEALGAAIAERMFRLKWIIRVGESRAIKVTAAGHHHLKRELDLEWA